MAENPTASTASDDASDNGPAMFTGQRVMAIVLLVTTAIVFYLCWLLAQPFLPALAWALALAIVGMPLHRWIRQRVKRPSLAAGLSVLAVAIVIVAPAFFVAQQVVSQAVSGATQLKQGIESGELRRQLMSSPQLASVVHFIEKNVNMKGAIEAMVGGAGGTASSIVSGSISAIIQTLVVFFCLFFFFRDRDKVVAMVWRLAPLGRGESDRLFKRLGDTVQATIFGTLVVAAIQGTLGGLMFWWLELPLPLLWGVVMGLLAIVPILGAFIIWMPAALVLAMQGNIWQAVVLTVWGTVVIGLVDNLLYPMLVGSKLRLHTLPVFFSIVGGLFVFGASGLVIGPLILAVADGLVDVWRRRMIVDDENVEHAST